MTAKKEKEIINPDVILPDYMQKVYYWAYVSPKNVPLLDRPFVVNTILWGNMNKLRDSALEEIEEGDKVLQVATVYGDQVVKTAEKVGPKGRYDVLDITPIQVERWSKRLEEYPQATVIHADAEKHSGKYDKVMSFFLLHEVPDAKKTRIIDNMMKNVKDDGKLIFVDYHEPKALHPLKFLMRCINRLLEPFAESIWNNEISSFATNKDDYIWQKYTYFGGLYQKVVVTKKR